MGEPFDGMWGDCAAMRALFETLERVAPTDLTLLIHGETGTGKELVARSVHRRSRRAAGPFVAVNCAALPGTLVESELFGFEKGSFTGAVRAHAGLIEQAHGGTLFLDEIGELPLAVQAKLLRVLQDRQVQRLGAARSRTIDVRFVAATHQDLPGMVEGRAFRRDLYHRVLEVALEVPALRDRGDDLDGLADLFVMHAAAGSGRKVRLTPAARAALRTHDWPGNVRELENSLRRAVMLCDADELQLEHLQLAGAGAGAAPRTLAEIVAIAVEGAVRQALRRAAGDPVRAAAELGILPAHLRALAAQHHIAVD